MLNTEIQELAVSLGFHLEESKIYVYRENHLEYTISNTIISVLDKTNRDIETYPTSEENILKVMNVSETIKEIKPSDLSLHKDGGAVNSEIKNRALTKMDEDSMSKPFTLDDCEALGFTLKLEGLNECVSLIIGDFEFCCSLTTLDTIKFKVILSTLVPSPHLKMLINPTRKQVDEVYHFFTGEHLDFSPKQKVYNWENCFGGEGYYIRKDCSVLAVIRNQPRTKRSFDIYPTKEDAEAALAHCQLLHIVNKINTDYPKASPRYYTVATNPINMDYTGIYIRSFSNTNTLGGLYLYTQKGAEILIRDNEELLKTYFKIK